MPVRVTLTKVLPDWWGADEAWEDGGAEFVKLLVQEDMLAFIEDIEWKIEKVE